MLAASALLSPEVAFVFLAIAALGFVLEASVPGVGFGAVLALGLVGLSAWVLGRLSPRPAGLALIALAAVLLVAGVFVRGRVLWCAGGGLALLAAGATLFADPLPPVLVLPVAVAVPVAAAVLGRLVSRMWAEPSYRGVAGTLVGMTGEVREGGGAGEPVRVLVAGALWRARADQPLAPGARVVVTAQEDLELRVTAPADEEGRGHGPE